MVLTEGCPAVLVVVTFGVDLVVLGFAFVIAAEEEVVVLVVLRPAGWPVACCRSLACSLMSVGPS